MGFCCSFLLLYSSPQAFLLFNTPRTCVSTGHWRPACSPFTLGCWCWPFLAWGWGWRCKSRGGAEARNIWNKNGASVSSKSFPSFTCLLLPYLLWSVPFPCPSVLYGYKLNYFLSLPKFVWFLCPVENGLTTPSHTCTPKPSHSHTEISS